MKTRNKRLSQAMLFILMFGVVSLFSDMTHEGAELPHLVRTVQKRPLVGNIEYLGGEASHKRRLSSF